MLYLTPMGAFLAIISFFDNGLVLGNNLQMQVSRMMEELLDLREDFADLQKDIVNMRRDLNQDRLEKQTLIGKINETICRCPKEYVAGRQKELFSSDSDQKVVKSTLLSYEDLKKYDMLLKGLAKEKDIRINFGKKLDAVEERYGLRLSDLATKIGNITEHTEKRLNVKISANEVAFGIKLEAKVSTVELKLKENISRLNQTINNLYTQIEVWRLEQEEFPHCEDGWREYKGSCYSFVLRNMSWLEAEQYCQAFNSHLIRIDNHIEFHFIQGVLNELYQTAPKDGIHSVSSYWTAANDIMKEGHWVWSPRNVPMRYTVWMEKEPNNYRGNENCVDLSYGRQFKMNDLDCESKISFICEIYRKMDG